MVGPRVGVLTDAEVLSFRTKAREHEPGLRREVKLNHERLFSTYLQPTGEHSHPI